MNKYGAKTTECRAGHRHASGREAKRCNELHLLLRAGEIEDLARQPFYTFVINGQTLRHGNGHLVGYTADFTYIDRQTAKRIVEESKGYTVRDWPLRKAIFQALYPDLVLREV